MCSESNVETWHMDSSARVPRWQLLCHAHINTNPALWEPPSTLPGQGAQLCQVPEEIQCNLWAAHAAMLGRSCLGLDGYTEKLYSNRLKWCGSENKYLSFHIRTWTWRNIYQHTCYYASVTAALWEAVLLFFSQLSEVVCINSLRLAKFEKKII